MSKKTEWVVTNIGDGYVVVPVGEGASDFKAIIRLNETSYDIWNGISAGKSVDEIADKLIEDYEGLDKTEAEEAVKKIINKMEEEGIEPF